MYTDTKISNIQFLKFQNFKRNNTLIGVLNENITRFLIICNEFREYLFLPKALLFYDDIDNYASLDDPPLGSLYVIIWSNIFLPIELKNVIFGTFYKLVRCKCILWKWSDFIIFITRLVLR
jgi:hypothetical protein